MSAVSEGIASTVAQASGLDVHSFKCRLCGELQIVAVKKGDLVSCVRCRHPKDGGLPGLIGAANVDGDE